MIIKSLLDADWYKFTMGDFVHLLHPDVPVKYGLVNRTTSVRIIDYVPLELIQEELDAACKLRALPDEIKYLKRWSVMHPEYIFHFTDYQLPQVHAENHDSVLRLETPDPWLQAIHWETIQLSIINKLYFDVIEAREGKTREAIWQEGERRLLEKIAILKQYPEIKFIEFGTRRRRSFEWQRRVIEILKTELPQQLLGTSNVALAMEFNLQPSGTMAHELFMVYACIALAEAYRQKLDPDEALRTSHNQVIRDWQARFAPNLLIALTDTFGSDFFFRDFTEEQARIWQGLRQDSGDPIVFGEKAIKFYQDFGINPLAKTLVFSDGLDINTILRIYQHFQGRIQMVFGWGTNLTNDLGHKTLSLVVKIIGAAGRPAVKLSDNIAKAIGPRDEIARYQRAFGYTNDYQQDCRY